MKFDWTVNAGEMIAALVLLVAFITAHTQNVRKLQDIETKVGLMYEWFKTTVMFRRGGSDPS